MFNWTWQGVDQSLKSDSEFDRPGWEYVQVNGRVLSDLSPAIQKEVSGYEVGPFMSHGKLCLFFPSNKEIIGLYAVSNYEVEITRFYTHNFSPYFTIIVQSDRVLEEVKKHINEIIVNNKP